MFYPKKPIFKYPDVESQLTKWNMKTSQELLKWLTTAPNITTYRINLLRTDFKRVKTDFLQELHKKYKSPPEIFAVDAIPDLICIKPIDIMCKQPVQNCSEVIVDAFCGAALLRGAHIYGPGVLAMQTGTKLGETVNVYADLEGNCKKGTKNIYESSIKTFIGVGIVKMQRYQLYGVNTNPRGVAVEMESTVSGVPTIGDLSSEKVLLQNFPSIVCCHVLDPQPGETILDMCASPGNKTTHIAELMNDKGIIIALDKTESKIQFVRMKQDQFKLNSVKSFAIDATKALETSETSNKNVLDGPPYPPESFDRILLDAPCSALGNRPLLVSKLSCKMIDSYIPVQKKLFTNAVGLLKSNGVLVYSTCTITEAENEGIVLWAMNKFPEMKLVKASPIFGGQGLDNGLLDDEKRKYVQRFGPGDGPIDGVGFFIAKFIKCENGSCVHKNKM